MHQTFKSIRHLRILSVLNNNAVCVSAVWQEIPTSMTKKLKIYKLLQIQLEKCWNKSLSTATLWFMSLCVISPLD